MRAHVKESSRCFYRDDRQQVQDPSGLPACDEARRAARLAQFDAREARRISDGCTPGQILVATGQSDATALVSAIAARTDCMVRDAYPRAGNRSPCLASCPLTLRLYILGGTADVGWQSQGHGTTVPESPPATVELFNCSGHTVKTCQVFAATAGVTTQVAPSGTPPLLAAAVTSFTTDLTGTITYTGALDSVEHMELAAAQRVDTFVVGQTGNFPLCAGGTAPGDSGTCSAGPNQGKPCTVGAVFPIGPTSPNCPPDPGNHAGYMSVDATLVSEPVSLEATVPRGPGGSFLCHCPGQAQLNACPDGICNPDEACSAKPAQACFPATITRTGSTSPLVLAAVGCAEGSKAALNAVIGLPGPFAITQRMEVSLP